MSVLETGLCLQTNQCHVYFEALRFTSKWNSGKVAQDVENSENNLCVTGTFSACLTTIKLYRHISSKPSTSYENDVLENLNQTCAVLRLFYFVLYYLEKFSSALGHSLSLNTNNVELLFSCECFSPWVMYGDLHSP